MGPQSRRTFLTNSGVILTLPVFSSLLPRSAEAAEVAPSRKKFVGVFSPSGALMSQNVAGFTDNGNWTFEGALKPIVTNGLQSKVMILRGIQSPSGAVDTHWANTAGFLSCAPILLGAQRPIRCGKSFDQFVAEKNVSPVGSVHVGWKPMNRNFSGDHATYSDRYLDWISWRAPDRPNANFYSASDLGGKLFSSSMKGAKVVRSLHRSRKSVLDLVLQELGAVNRKLSTADQARLQAYTDGVRETELAITRDLASEERRAACVAPSADADADLYIRHFRTMHKMIAQALKCDLISCATIMYDDGVGDEHLLHPQATKDHHGYAHHKNEAGAQAELNVINTRHASLFTHFLQEMSVAGQMEDSLVLWGSNMSDGNLHTTDNLPMVLAGGGSDLKFGSEVGSPQRRIAKADLFLEMSELFGLGLSKFGEGEFLSTGAKLGLKL